jgi:hypothetical protein
MQHSGPNNECPVCGRKKGDYCRFSDDRILCYQGQTLGPPALAIGETIKIDGIEWALVATNVGFSGNSSMYVPHDPSGTPQNITTPNAAIRKAVGIMYEKDRFEKDIQLAEWSLRLVENLEEFERMPPDRIRESLEICRDSFALHKSLLVQTRKLRRQLPDVGLLADGLQAGLRAIEYQGKDIRRFWFDTLLDPGGGRGQQLAQQLRQEVQP